MKDLQHRVALGLSKALPDLLSRMWDDASRVVRANIDQQMGPPPDPEDVDAAFQYEDVRNRLCWAGMDTVCGSVVSGFAEQFNLQGHRSMGIIVAAMKVAETCDVPEEILEKAFHAAYVAQETGD